MVIRKQIDYAIGTNYTHEVLNLLEIYVELMINFSDRFFFNKCYFREMPN